MKRTLLFILSILMLFSLSACVSKTPEDDYKYNIVSGLKMSEDTIFGTFSRPLTKGSLAVVNYADFYGNDVVEEEWGSEFLTIMFDEETKVAYPLCFSVGCDHKNRECFAYQIQMSFLSSYCTAIRDNVLLIGWGKEGTENVYAYYYSLDGTLQEKYLFDLTKLKRADQSEIENPSVPGYYASNGNTVYIDVLDSAERYNINNESTDGCNRWLLSFNTDSNEFEVVSNYTLPDNYSTLIRFGELNDDNIVICYGGYYDVKIDLSNGEYTSSSHTEVHDKNNEIWSNGHILYNNKKYIPKESTDTDRVYQSNIGTDEITVSRLFADSTYCLHSVVMESANGLVFSYYNNGESWQDETYECEVNGQMKTLRKPTRWVFVTKDDYFDGQIDDPWYYDAETGMFVQK